MMDLKTVYRAAVANFLGAPAEETAILCLLPLCRPSRFAGQSAFFSASRMA
jgi:hypothetical protein